MNKKNQIFKVVLNLLDIHRLTVVIMASIIFEPMIGKNLALIFCKSSLEICEMAPTYFKTCKCCKKREIGLSKRLETLVGTPIIIEASFISDEKGSNNSGPCIFNAVELELELQLKIVSISLQ